MADWTCNESCECCRAFQRTKSRLAAIEKLIENAKRKIDERIAERLPSEWYDWRFIAGLREARAALDMKEEKK